MVGPLNQVVQDAAIGGCSDAVGVFLGIGRGDGMGIGANAADPLGDLLGIEGVTASQDHLKSPEHLADALGIDNDIVCGETDNRKTIFQRSCNRRRNHTFDNADIAGDARHENTGLFFVEKGDRQVLNMGIKIVSQAPDNRFAHIIH